jgi:hypothetical protein
VIILAGYNPSYPEHNMGDAILMIPFISHLAEHAGEPVFYKLNNHEVEELIPDHPNLHAMRTLPLESTHRILRCSVNDLIERQHRRIHPTIGIFQLHNMQVPTDQWAIRPQLSYREEQVPAYDYVISPFTEDKNREMPMSTLRSLLEQLPGSKCLIGRKGEPMNWAGVSYGYGESLHWVCSLMQRARCVITVDNGPGRLAHALDHPHHILLASTIVPYHWAAYPMAKMLYAEPRAWSVDNILELCRLHKVNDDLNWPAAS